jgi:hypothetical protein
VAELAWYQQLLADTARLILRSEEMRTAVENTRISVDTVVEAVVDAAPMLLCAEEVDVSGILSLDEVVSAFAGELSRTARTALARRKRAGGLITAAGLVGVAVVVTVGWGAFAMYACVLSLGFFGRAAFRALQSASSYWILDLDWNHVFRQRVLEPFLREQINLVTNTPQYERFFHVTSVPSLSDLSGREQIVATSPAERLTKVTSAMTTGSIAISGPRGVGKTTLLRGFCDSRFAVPDAPELRLMVSAPVVYDVRDFVVHLYKQLCIAVTTGPGRAPEHRSRRSRLYAALATTSFIAGLALLASLVIEHSSRAQLAQAIYLLVGGVLAILGGMSAVRPYLVRVRGARPLAGRPHRALVTLLSLAFTVSGIILIAWTLAERPRRVALPSTQSLIVMAASLLIANGVILFSLWVRPNVRERVAPFEDEARQNLRQIQFLQTFTTGHSGTLTVPGGAQLGRTVSKQLAEQRLSFPEIVDQYREFASKTGRWWRELHGGVGRLVVGIDEIDKIHDAVSAERFINEVRAIFGTPNCLYLVSVSDEALIGFQQRSPALRAAFDSAFDEMIRVDRLSLADVGELLRRRVAGISDPFIALCYVLSGGLPRDALRTARALVEVRSGQRGEIGDMAKALVTRELSLIKQTLLRGITGEDKASGSQNLVKDLVDETWPEDLMKAASERARTEDDTTSRWLSMALYFLATVAETFGPGLDRTIQDLGRTDLLAHARAALAIDTNVAGELVSRFRGERGLPLLD